MDPYEEITEMKPSQIDSIYYAIYTILKSFYSTKIMLILLGSDETCTPTLVSLLRYTHFEHPRTRIMSVVVMLHVGERTV